MRKAREMIAVLLLFCMVFGCTLQASALEWPQQELNIVYHSRSVWDSIQNADYEQNYSPCPDISSREFWDNLPDEITGQLIAEGEKYLAYEWPVIYATDYLIYSRTGSRDEYQNKQFARRTALTALVMAECAENEGRFLDDIVNGIYLIMEEGTWTIPAHNVYIRDTEALALPDYTRPVIALFSSETAAVLGLTEYLLRSALNDFNPIISVDINQRLQERIFGPYLAYHFWWMGDGESQMLNWTPWITLNVMLAAFTRPDDVLSVDVKEQVMQVAAVSTDFFLDEYANDGCCGEGASYYSNAALRNYFVLDVLNTVTNGTLNDVLQSEKIYNMGNYITRMCVGNGVYFNFGDAFPILGGRTALEYLYGKGTGCTELMNFAARDLQSNAISVVGGREPYYCILKILSYDEIKNYQVEPVIPKDNYFESEELMVARDSHFIASIKGSNNGVAHNHNDVGSFIIYKDNLPMFIDLGVGVYTADTFNPLVRYKAFYMQSGYHNLPTIGDFVQQAGDGAGTGKEFAAKDVVCSFTDDKAQITMDIANAYRRVGEDQGVKVDAEGNLALADGAAQIRSYVRTFTLNKEENIVIQDVFNGDLPVILSLMLAGETTVTKTENGYSLAIGDLGTCEIEGAKNVTVEEVELTDPILNYAWQGKAYRALVEMDDGNILTLTIR